jgi:hypothetical protein
LTLDNKPKHLIGHPLPVALGLMRALMLPLPAGLLVVSAVVVEMVAVAVVAEMLVVKEAILVTILETTEAGEAATLAVVMPEADTCNTVALTNAWLTAA